MMSVEGPVLTGIIARSPAPKENLAAYGICLALLLLCEAPILGIISGAIALVRDQESFRSFRRFSLTNSIVLTALLAILCLEPVLRLVTAGVFGVDAATGELVQHGLWPLTLCPLAVGMRRFYQGILVKAQRSRLVSIGTVIRLSTMLVLGVVLFRISGLPGVQVATIALGLGMVCEGAFVWAVSRELVSELPPESHASVAKGVETSSQLAIARFYYPFALSTVIAISIHPLVSFFLARGAMPLESLAVFPVLTSLTLLFRSLGFAFQEAAVSALAESGENIGAVRSAARAVAVGSTLGLGVIVLTPLSTWWYVSVSGLSPELVEIIRLPAAALFISPALATWVCFERGAFLAARRTAAITWSGALELTVVVAMMSLGIRLLPFPGVNVAAVSLLCAGLLSASFLRALRARGDGCE